MIRARKQAFSLVLCDDIISEFEGILRKKFKISPADISEISAIVSEAATEIIHDLSPVPDICRDPNDNMIIACAVDAHAGYIAVSYTHLRAHETGRNLVCR